MSVQSAKRSAPLDGPPESSSSKKICSPTSFTKKTTSIKKFWKTVEKAPTDGDTVLVEPFPCCMIQDFIKERASLHQLIKDLDKLKLKQKNNDLYKFRQSGDLFNCNTPSVVAFKEFLSDDVRPWLQHETGLDLSGSIDIFYAKYGKGDHLLCHDDKLEGRRIAYILYLVPEDWSAEDGGALDLFSSDNGQPVKVVKSLIPKFNSFAFFEVSPKSYHQVAEVLSKKVRVSITGWFHGPVTAIPPKVSDRYKVHSSTDITEEEFYHWLNPLYLDPVQQAQIREHFEENSEISLPKFLKSERYEEVATALSRLDQEWIRTGPPNKRFYDKLDVSDSSCCELIQKCVHFLHSDALCLILSNLTGLKLHPMAEDLQEFEGVEEDEDDESQNVSNNEKPGNSSLKSKEKTTRAADSLNRMQDTEVDSEIETFSASVVNSEIRRWQRGSYSLLHDDDGSEIKAPCLDLRLSFNCPADWNLKWGGNTTYVAKGDKQELLTAPPAPNSLTLVYKETETLSFIQYIKSNAPADFHDITVSFIENTAE